MLTWFPKKIELYCSFEQKICNDPFLVLTEYFYKYIFISDKYLYMLKILYKVGNDLT